jgi:hypothetical protein
MEEGSPQAGGWSSLDVVMTTSRCTCMYRIREKKAIRYMYLISGGRVRYVVPAVWAEKRSRPVKQTILLPVVVSGVVSLSRVMKPCFR